MTPDNPALDPISAAMIALRTNDPVLAVLAEVRETFGAEGQPHWDEGISRYLKSRYDAIVNGYFGGDYARASKRMDEDLANFDVAETVHRACDVSDSPVMMELLAYAMAMAAVGTHAVWMRFEHIIGHLYHQLPARISA